MSSYLEVGHVSHEFFSIRKWHGFRNYHFSNLGAGWYQDKSTATCRYRLDMYLQVYHSSSEQCGIPQFANELNSASSCLGILLVLLSVLLLLTIFVLYNEPNIWDMTGYPDIAILPDLKLHISNQMIMLQEELASYGDLTDSKVNNSMSFLVRFMLPYMHKV
jgi:hypothetical protein